MTVATIISTLIAGIEQGMLTFLSAAGLSLIRAGLGTMNFGQGGFFIIGAYICLYMTSLGIPFILAMLAGFAAAALVGFILEQLIMPLYGMKRAFSMVVTLGYSYILCDLMMLLCGSAYCNGSELLQRFCCAEHTGRPYSKILFVYHGRLGPCCNWVLDYVQQDKAGHLFQSNYQQS